MTPLPDLVLYARPECSLCDEAREAVELVIADRRERGLPVPTVIERNIEADPELHRTLLERIPVVELGGQRVELVVSIGKLRRLLREVLGEAAVADETPGATPGSTPGAEVATEA